MEVFVEAAMCAFFGWQAVDIHRMMPAIIENWRDMVARSESDAEYRRGVAARIKAREAVEAAGGNASAQYRAMNAVCRVNPDVVWGDHTDRSEEF